jgi:imidazolonepropionase-like amidohydrolase
MDPWDALKCWFVTVGVVEVGSHVDDTDARVVELGDRTLLPGFIDCHVHTTIDPARLVQPAVSDSAVTIALNSLPILGMLLENGFTTVRDLGCLAAEPITVYLRRAVAQGTIIGPRMVVAPHIISARGGHGDLSSLLGNWGLSSARWPTVSRRSPRWFGSRSARARIG